MFVVPQRKSTLARINVGIKGVSNKVYENLCSITGTPTQNREEKAKNLSSL